MDYELNNLRLSRIDDGTLEFAKRTAV